MPQIRPLHTAVKPPGFPALFLCAAALAASAAGLGAQEPPPAPPRPHAERPFATPRAHTLPRRAVRLELGGVLGFDRRLPLSGLEGDLLELTASVAVGVADGVEARVEGAGWQRMALDERDPAAPLAGELELDGEATRDATDPALALRVRLTGRPETAVQAAFQAGVRLPVAGNESGLGRDVSDVSAALLVAWRRGPLDVGAEAAFAILGSPTQANSQDDQGRLGLVAEFSAIPDRLVVGGEVRSSFGDEDPGNELMTEITIGSRARLGPVWADAAYRRVVTEDIAGGALQAGLTRTF